MSLGDSLQICDLRLTDALLHVVASRFRHQQKSALLLQALRDLGAEQAEPWDGLGAVRVESHVDPSSGEMSIGTDVDDRHVRGVTSP